VNREYFWSVFRDHGVEEETMDPVNPSAMLYFVAFACLLLSGLLTVLGGIAFLLSFLPPWPFFILAIVAFALSFGFRGDRRG
jgi:hypothetical protein